MTTSPPRPRVLLADDHALLCEALTSLLESDFDVVETVRDGRALVEAASRLRPDAIVADITMPELNGIDAMVELFARGLRVPVVFLTMHRDPTFARRALEAGASGFVLKHSASLELITAIRVALEGRTYLTPQLTGEVLGELKRERLDTDAAVEPLTPRQREVLRLLAGGASAKEIGARLSISPRTAEFHKYQMMQVLGLKTSAELIHFAIKHGVVDL